VWIRADSQLPPRVAAVRRGCEIMPLLTRLEVAFAIITASTGCVSLIFNTFHVQLFREVYGISPAAFATVHAVYAVWNTANDLGSGYVADVLAARSGSRIPLVRVGGLLWVTVGFL
jgi:Na+/melibiose symporter-like transporter